MIRRKIDDVTYETYYGGQNFVAKYPGQHSLKYDYNIILKNIDKDAYILDIGCRGGETVKMFQDMGYKNAYGTDIGEEAKIKCIQNFGEEWTNKYFKVGDIQHGNPYDFEFDFITFSHTLEHLMQPEKGMSIIHDSLKEDGFLFIAVPSDYEDANGDIQIMLADQGAQFHWVFYESEKDIIEFCESSGFNVLDSKDLKETKHEYLIWLQKEEKDNLLNDDIQFYQKPSVHWIMEDMFEKVFYQKLENDFPKVEDFDLDDEVMGGRFEVAMNNPKFWEKIESSKSWKKFYDYFNSEEFVMSMFESFGETMESIGTNLDLSNLKFDKDACYNSFNDIEDKTDKSLNDIFVYFDFSIARNGYMREVHTDMNNRVLSFMLYFSDVEGEGGTLELYKGNPLNIDSDENISLEKTIKPKKNLGVWKLDDGDSWHAVPKMKNNDGWRKFVYVAITSKQVGVWKNKHTQWPNKKQLKIKRNTKVLMYKDTSNLRNRMLQYEDIEDRLKVLHNSYKGKTCYIVSAGPSLKNFEENYLKDKLKDELVISIKQSMNILKGIADFHILNFTNFEPYDYSDSNDTIVTWEVFEQYHPQMILDNNFKCELMLPVVGNHESDIVKRINESQAGTESFDDWTLDKTMNRMYGPGIMYEVVIHLALYLGVKEIRTIGWDIGDVSKFKQNNLYEDVWQDHAYDGSDNIQYAKTPMNYHEVNTVVKSVKYLSEWLKTKGVDFKIISDRNPAHESVERIEL